ncbi:MAG: DUF484 family protein [Pseudomonadota bacterium]
MADHAAIEDLKERILSDPGVILDDPDMIRGLLDADPSFRGRQVVDLRSVLVGRLEQKIGHLEDTHREVLAAAYDNVAGTNQVHKACLALLDAADFAGFLNVMVDDLPQILSVDIVRLGLEAPGAVAGKGLGPEGNLNRVVIAMPQDGVGTYITHGRGLGPRQITLRQLAKASPELYGDAAAQIRSEAAVRLDLGAERRPGLLLFGSNEKKRFHRDQGTDLLTFFCGVFERTLRRWIA